MQLDEPYGGWTSQYQIVPFVTAGRYSQVGRRSFSVHLIEDADRVGVAPIGQQ